MPPPQFDALGKLVSVASLRGNQEALLNAFQLLVLDEFSLALQELLNDHRFLHFHVIA